MRMSRVTACALSGSIAPEAASSERMARAERKEIM
jgi:hypothetical protein